MNSPEFVLAYAALLAESQKYEIPKKLPPAGTLSALLVEYYQSIEFKSLKLVTQKNYKGILERLRNDYGNNQVADLTKRNVLEMLDEKVATPGAARNFLKRLKRLLDFAVDREWIVKNPVSSIHAPASPNYGSVQWPESAIAMFEDAYPSGTRERLALYLLLYTGQRRSDVVRMGRQHLMTNGSLYVQQKKGRKGKDPVTLEIPILPPLKKEIDQVPEGQLQFIVTEYGRAFSEAGFSQWFTEKAIKAGLVVVDKDGEEMKREDGKAIRFTPHGLRKSAASALAEAGATLHEIAAITGHRSVRTLEIYTKAAEQKQLARNASDKLYGTKQRT